MWSTRHSIVASAALALAIAATVAVAPTADAAPTAFAPVDRPGPALSVPTDQLAASLRCTAGVGNATRTPVLLLPATAVNSVENYSWNWEPALTKAGIPWCTSDVPGYDGGQNLADIQTRGEYVTYAIRTMYAMAHRKISTLGHSQGGMIARWSLRFWPDTRAMVDDVIGIAPSNHGTLVTQVECTLPVCQPAFLQQGTATRFTAALNSGQETFAGISYTTIRTNLDEVVVPSTGAALSGPGSITNVAVQDKCPLDVSDHLLVGTADPVAESIAMDALNHSGPAQLSRVSPLVCLKPFMSGVNPLTFVTDDAASLAALAVAIATGTRVAAEPPLRCYVYAAGCP